MNGFPGIFPTGGSVLCGCLGVKPTVIMPLHFGLHNVGFQSFNGGKDRLSVLGDSADRDHALLQIFPEKVADPVVLVVCEGLYEVFFREVFA